MNFVLNSRQAPKWLQQCDEIQFYYDDKQAIPRFIEKYPDKKISLTTNLIHNLDWTELKDYCNLAHGNFVLRIAHPEHAEEAKAKAIPFYFPTNIDTFDQLQAAQKAGASEALIGGPLFFDLNRVKKNFRIKLRIEANNARTDYLPRENGVIGSWIRPEGLEAYEPYIDTIQFMSKNSEQEVTLFNIYKNKVEWPGDLNMIIANLNYHGTNRMIPTDFEDKRLHCAQRCAMGIDCHYCYRMLDLANPERLKNYQPKTD